MPNTSLATKFVTVVKGIFGRKPDVSGQPGADDTTTAPESEAREGAAEPEVAQASEPVPEPAEEPEAAPRQAQPVAAGAASAAATETAAPQRGSATDRDETSGTDEAPSTAGTGISRTETSDAETSAEPARESTPAAAVSELEPEQREDLAAELGGAEATTQAASDEAMESARKRAAPALEELPVPNYEEATLPSVRGRLRKLTIEQVRDLRAYELAHEERPEFVKMYDNRIAKLQNEGQ
ncbi:hypothetical protein FHX37_2855 [Haloactinospora alba]|uniref:Uncharacterized protein n=1 Tax=Haloactinospora alba TaxID=405555 RepID=A0A543NM10_9ACTN|nr:hypothetical protein [Haloactinospora alba]TQN32868.1 hypothetical protein FHX37_2855 [Haloactinospora alba]